MLAYLIMYQGDPIGVTRHAHLINQIIREEMELPEGYIQASEVPSLSQLREPYHTIVREPGVTMAWNISIYRTVIYE